MADSLTAEQRSYCMSRVANKDTSLERLVRSGLHQRGLRFFKHLHALPGRPDVVFPTEKIIVFIDGDFWHGYRFPKWGHKLTPYWKEKIERNRYRDLRNFAKLRRKGWLVIRVWEHNLSDGLNPILDRICMAVNMRRGPGKEKSVYRRSEWKKSA